MAVQLNCILEISAESLEQMSDLTNGIAQYEENNLIFDYSFEYCSTNISLNRFNDVRSIKYKPTFVSKQD